ncbi:TetR/AcrR family transcriptional regulator [Lutibacter sp. B2]|nr:TetR/AcrR family transcriptional regulator [Lutibacter sp. B2]
MTSEKIKKASLESFAQKSYEGTTLAEIAEKVEIKKPSIYAHFASKEDVFFTVVEEEINNFCIYIDKIKTEIESNRAEKILFELLTKGMDYFYQNPTKKGFWKNVLFCPNRILKEKIDSKMSTISEKIYHSAFYIMEKGIKNKEIEEDNIEDIIYSFECFLHGNFALLLYDKFTFEKFNKSWDIYWNGIKKR